MYYSMYPRGETIKNSDELRNVTCHEYLYFIQESITKYLVGKTVVIPYEIKNLLNCLPSSDYDKTRVYGNDYTSFMKMLDANIIEWRRFYKTMPVLYNLLNVIVESVYANPNKGLERATAMVTTILSSPSEEHSISSRIESRMAKSSKKKLGQVFFWQPTNTSTPHKMESSYQKFKNTHVASLKVQHKTNTPSIRTYHYKENTSLPMELRFGTQAQYEGNIVVGRMPIVAPTFVSFIAQQKEKHPEKTRENKESDNSPITHIYFNNLKKTIEGIQHLERNKEGVLTDTLEHLEETYDNIAVITLPADNDWISHHSLNKTGEIIETDTVLNQIKEMVSERITLANSDFHISTRIRKLLFADAEEEQKIIDGLLQNSLQKLGLTRNKLTSDEKQALYFHFIKFELTDFIITKLNPVSFNMTCKDAIDRGGVSSAYYNLMKSLELNRPLNEEEFNRALYGAPLLVKGRSMNDHLKLICNAVDNYLKNPENAGAPDWLKTWRNNYSPKTAIVNQLNHYIEQKLSLEKPKMDAANTLKNLIDNPFKVVSFTFSEWSALQNGRLGDIFLNIKAQLSLDQQEKIAMLDALHRQTSALPSTDYDLGIKLWEYANSEDRDIQLDKRVRILLSQKTKTELPALLNTIDDLRKKLSQIENVVSVHAKHSP